MVAVEFLLVVTLIVSIFTFMYKVIQLIFNFKADKDRLDKRELILFLKHLQSVESYEVPSLIDTELRKFS